jgi:hypothetical protein
MSKFLEILEQHDPTNQSKMDAAFQAKFFLYEAEVPFSSKGSQIILHAEQGDIILEAVGMQARQDMDDLPEEEQQTVGSYDLDGEVEKLGAKALKLGPMGKLLGTKAQRAKSATKERDNVAGQAVDVYKKNTDSLKKAIASFKAKKFNVV